MKKNTNQGDKAGKDNQISIDNIDEMDTKL